MRRQADWSVVGGIAFTPFLEDRDDVSCSPLLWYSALVNALLEDNVHAVRKLLFDLQERHVFSTCLGMMEPRS